VDLQRGEAGRQVLLGHGSEVTRAAASSRLAFPPGCVLVVAALLGALATRGALVLGVVANFVFLAVGARAARRACRSGYACLALVVILDDDGLGAFVFVDVVARLVGGYAVGFGTRATAATSTTTTAPSWLRLALAVLVGVASVAVVVRVGGGEVSLRIDLRGDHELPSGTFDVAVRLLLARIDVCNLELVGRVVVVAVAVITLDPCPDGACATDEGAGGVVEADRPASAVRQDRGVTTGLAGAERHVLGQRCIEVGATDAAPATVRLLGALVGLVGVDLATPLVPVA